MWTTPTDVANLAARQTPVAESFKCTPKGRHHTWIDQIHESVAKTCLSLEVNGKVQKVILPRCLQPSGGARYELRVDCLNLAK